MVGCGASVPGRRPARQATPLAVAASTHEYPSRAPRQTAAGASSPAAAITRFALEYINWDADTVTGQMLQLAARSVGQARSAMQLAAAQTAGDYELQRGGIANRGMVEAVAPLQRSHTRWVLVTEEQTVATATDAYQGLRPAWHVTVVTVAEPAAAKWVISGWQPES